jgi:hypothetical protein
VDVFRLQALWILNTLGEDIKKLKETAVSDRSFLPISAANVNYTKLDESILPLSTYLNDVATGDHVNEVLSNVPTFPINASNVNYTKSDQTTIPLTTYINDIVNDIHTTINHINQQFPLFATNVNYTNEDNATKTV